MGSPIAQISVSLDGLFYSLILDNNTLRVLRSDNNKEVLTTSGLCIQDADESAIQSEQNTLVLRDQDRLQFIDFGKEHLEVG